MGPPRVLVVDDEVDIAKAIGNYIEAALGFAVTTASGGAEALQVLEQDTGRGVRLIVSDFRMPEMDGVEFLTKAAKLRPDVRRILVTAYPEMDLAIRALNETGVVHFLKKPVDPEEMARVVRELVEQAVGEAQRRQALDRAAGLKRGVKGRAP